MSDRPMRKVKNIHVFLLLLPLLPTAVKPLLPWRYNDSTSLPLGYYWKGDKEQAVKGSLVSFCLPREVASYAKARGYIGFGFCPGWAAMLLKPIAAVAGDVVEVQPEGVSINGMLVPHTPVFALDSKKRSHCYQFLGTHMVPQGYVFLLAPAHERSFDSRYWGWLPEDQIVETLTEAWTW
jgi:conjugative transfer signal peptidase TraF